MVRSGGYVGSEGSTYSLYCWPRDDRRPLAHALLPLWAMLSQFRLH
jgi:hypothetical protein